MADWLVFWLRKKNKHYILQCLETVDSKTSRVLFFILQNYFKFTLRSLMSTKLLQEFFFSFLTPQMAEW